MTAPYRSISTPEIASPPRPVPGRLKLRLLFGGGLAHAAWMLIAFGSIVVWIFAFKADVSALTVSGPYTTLRGEVVNVEPTSMEENHRRIYAVSFVFGDEPRHMGVSYTLGSRPEVGSEVPVEVPAGRIDLARIEGMRRQPFSAWVLFVVIVPLAGAGLAGWRVRRAQREIRLLSEGRLGHGKLVHKQETRMYVNNRQVHKLSFDYPDQQGRVHRLVVRTSATARLLDDAQEPLVYDGNDAALLDHLPGGPRIDASGQLSYDASPWSLLAAVGLPLLAVFVNLVAAVVVLSAG